MGDTPLTNHILVCDGPGRRMEELLPMLRELGYGCTYVPGVDELIGPNSEIDLLLVPSDIPGGPRGRGMNRLQQLHPGLPVVVIAHVRSLSVAIEFFRSGVADYLPAPLLPGQIQERLEEALSRPVDTFVEPCEILAAVPAASEEEEDGPGGNSAGDDLLTRLPCGVVVFGSDQRVTEVNPMAERMLGVTGVEAVQSRLADCAALCNPKGQHDRDAKNWPVPRAFREKILRSVTLSLERPDRTRIWVRVEAAPVLSGGQVERVVTSLTNITELCAALRTREG